jgi:hypothetical protein
LESLEIHPITPIRLFGWNRRCFVDVDILYG